MIDAVTAPSPRRSLSRTVVLGATALMVATALPSQASAGTARAADDDGGEVYVVQGLPDVVVDVALDGKTVAEDMATADVSDAIALPGDGAAVLTVTDQDGAVLVESTLPAGTRSADAVVHLPAASDGDPLVTLFANDLDGVTADQARLSVAHTAVVPPADIRVNGDVLFANVSNGESLDLVVPADTYSVDIVPAGEDGPAVLGPVDLTVTGSSLNKVYAVGDPSKDSMTVAVHVLDVKDIGSGAPTSVDTGMRHPLLDLAARVAGWLEAR